MATARGGSASRRAPAARARSRPRALAGGARGIRWDRVSRVAMLVVLLGILGLYVGPARSYVLEHLPKGPLPATSYPGAGELRFGHPPVARGRAAPGRGARAGAPRARARDRPHPRRAAPAPGRRVHRRRA